MTQHEISATDETRIRTDLAAALRLAARADVPFYAVVETAEVVG